MGDLLPMVDPAAVPAADRSQTFRVPGENPLDAGARLYSAIEIACLDLIGKALGRPVCDLLGGRARDDVPFSAYLFYKHAGGGGEGGDAREDEYGEALSPEALVPTGEADDGGVRLHGDQAEGRRARARRGDCDHRGALRGVRPRRAAAHRSQLRLVGRYVGPRRAVASRDELGAGAISRIRRRVSTAWPRCAAACSRRASTRRSPATSRSPPSPICKPASSADAVQIVLCDPHYWGGIRQIQHLLKTVPDVRPRPVDALEQPSRRVADGHGPRRRRRRRT